MSAWKHGAAAALAQADRLGDRVRRGIKRVTGYRRPLVVVPYLGYGTPERVTMSGRVLEQKRDRPASATDRRWRNVVRLYRALQSDEVPGAVVRACLNGCEQEAAADDEGYVCIEFRPAALPEDRLWHDVALQVVQPKPGPPAVGRVLVPPPTARVGIVSDIDDTIVRTGVESKLRMLVALALSNPHTRVPFEGVGAFYRALQRGASGDEHNPFFYVSSSPWNLYTPLIDFMALNDIPLGPLHLKDYGEHILFTAGDHRTHKLAAIENILATYPQLPFVLIGDSGEQDPEIYRDVAQRHPGRVRVIYIRCVGNSAARLASLAPLAEEVLRAGSELVLAAHSEIAAAHAARVGLLSAGAMPGIRADRLDDASATDAV